MELQFSKGSVQLNEEQYKVVTSPSSENQRILASAGSGKTTTITARIAYLVEEYNVDPSRIMLVSFSRAAAEEMIHRVHRLIGPVKMYAGTFHALSAEILRDMAPHMIIDQPFIDEFPYRLVKWLDTDIAKKWVKRFRTIIVDEFQDCNEVQWQILKGIYHPWATMSIVGDDAQNIYTWRGSSVDFILNFHEKIPRVKDYQLCRNYRSTESIVTIANSVMRFIPTLPFKEKMVANLKGGRKPEVHFFFRSSDEYDWIVNSIHKMTVQYPQFTFAVLSRYNSDLFKIEERLHCKQLTYKLYAHTSNSHSHTHSQTQKQESSIQPTITLATIHASKGLEWDIVFFMNLHDDIFPSRKSDEDIICERRLFYVGVTRAKKGLYMTYSRHERSLSRFVREVPRPFLIFHNVTSFKLSTVEAASTTMSIDDMIHGFDGADWSELREQGNVPQMKEPRTEAIYPFGQLFTVPEWVKTNDVRDTWFEMIRLLTLRECAMHHNKLQELCTPEISEALLTLRIYREDIEFWELYETELEHLVHKFMKHTPEMKPLDYNTLETYVQLKLPHLTWDMQEMSHALVIISKIRGQLRPLRHHGFDLDEFTFGVVRNSVPTELRPEVLGSWHSVIDPSKKTRDILGDLWRIAAIKSIIEGRNIPLYQYNQVLPYLIASPALQYIEQHLFATIIEKAIPPWIVSQEHPVFHCRMEVEGIRPIQFDIMTEKTAYAIFFDNMPSNDDKILLLLKQYAYEEIYDKTLESIGFVNISTGLIMHYAITSTIREQLSHMWQHLQRKYNLYC
jgi:ATP-dependent exoDNAse (exonuclease V) beta subunit